MTEMVRNITTNQDVYRAPPGTSRVADFNKKRRYFCNTPHDADRHVPFKDCLKALLEGMKKLRVHRTHTAYVYSMGLPPIWQWVQS
jgi:hypothetical protein